MNKFDFDDRKYRCGTGECTAPIPQVYLERVQINRHEIPYFTKLIDELGDVLVAYLVLQPAVKGFKPDTHDPTSVFIWVDPAKHLPPNDLVNGGINLVCKSFTMEQEKEYFANYDKTYFLQMCRRMNCPICSKNYKNSASWVMSSEQYLSHPLVANSVTRR